MRPLSAVAVAAATLIVGTQVHAQSIPREWKRVAVTAGAALANTSLEDQGEGHVGLTAFGAISFRLNDVIGIGIHGSRWLASEHNERTFWFATTDYFPLYRSGNGAVRLSAGVGAARIVGQPFAGGHATSDIKGRSAASMIGASYDFHVGVIAVSPYVNASAALGSGLTERYCSTAGYLSGDFTPSCSTSPAGAVRVTSAGFSLGVR